MCRVHNWLIMKHYSLLPHAFLSANHIMHYLRTKEAWYRLENRYLSLAFWTALSTKLLSISLRLHKCSSSGAGLTTLVAVTDNFW